MDPFQPLVSWGLVFVFWMCLCLTQGNKVEIKGSMGSKRYCKSVKDKTQWLSEKSSALITGKSESRMAKECSIIFGTTADATKSVRLRLHFDFLYFNSCGVRLQINQSSTSDFEKSKDNREMFLSGCDHHNPGPLYAQPKHYVMISLNKTSDRLADYNFRLNVSMTEHLPVTGPPLRVVIIVSFVCLVVVVTAAFVLVKYANHLSIEWHEERREEIMDRAIHLYNSSSREASGEESTMALVEPGVGVRTRAAQPELAFVHRDGRVLRFQTHSNQDEEVSSSERIQQPKLHQTRKTETVARSKGRGGSPGEEPTHFYFSFLQNRQSSGHGGGAGASSLSTSEQASCRNQVADNADAVSVGGVDLPPSYEEALCMPLPSSLSAGDGFGSGADVLDGSGTSAGAEGGVGGGGECSGSNSADTDMNKGKTKIKTSNNNASSSLVSESDISGNNSNPFVNSDVTRLADEESERQQNYTNFRVNLEVGGENTTTAPSNGREGRENEEQEGDHHLLVYPDFHSSSLL